MDSENKPREASAHPVTVTDTTFEEEVLNYPGPVVVECWAQWCAPCKGLALVFDRLAAEYSGQVKLAKLNVEQNPVMASEHLIMSLPTLLIFENGKKVDTLTGDLEENTIRDYIESMVQT
jgi:thioredoxin